ncbi:AtpZ/AtpI family protein [Rossellomorea sp. NS-SX7]|jgi:ATP synthase protein I|uniref:AtpZ/AtpI family protein n=1 Tax=Rossellomorea sp. NS-SX7 TaxID=3463856 RepID=UPI00405A2FE6
MGQKNQSPYKAMAIYTAILSQLVGSILVGIFLGRWVDQQADSAPLFLIIGLFLGLATGIYAMLRTLRHLS